MLIMQLPHVFFQVKVSTEAFAAETAGEWFGFVVSVHVEGEIINLMESFTACFALVLLLVAVCQLMVLIVAFLVESFTAELTNIRLVTLVYSHVCV